jgi:hypothetical protein
MRVAWLVVAACSSPAPPVTPEPIAIVADASDASIDAAPIAVRSHQIAAAERYACALRDQLMCWGKTPLGDHDKPTVVPIEGAVGIALGETAIYAWTAGGDAWSWSGKRGRKLLTGVREIAADDSYACAHHDDGRVTCWRDGKLVEIAAAARAIVVAGDHACAQREHGDVWCWSASNPLPLPAAHADGAIALAGHGREIAAVMADGEIVAWDPSTDRRLPAPRLPGIVKLAIGALETCALGPQLVCWKEETPASRREVPLRALDVVVGGSLACALTAGGVACWGQDHRRTTRPIEVAGLADVVQLSAGGRHTCARRANGTVACWGERLTDAWSTMLKLCDLRPVDVAIDDAIELVVAGRNACARRKTGTVVCWGHDDVSEVQPRPTRVQRYVGSRALVAHRAGVCALRDGRLDCRADQDDMFEPFARTASRIWSGNFLGAPFLCAKVAGGMECQRGLFARHGEPNGAEPTTFDTGLGDVIDLLLPDAEDNMCLVRDSGLVECRGIYEHTEWTTIVEDGVGLAEGTNRDVCALRKTGRVSCWGKDHVVTDVPGLRDAVELVGTGLHACARRKSGRVVCWGDMDLVGHGQRADTDTPAFVL